MKRIHLTLVLIFIAAAVNLKAQNAPSAMDISEVGYNDVTLSVTANSAGDNILIAITDVPKRNSQNQVIPGGLFGTPEGTYQVGDEISGGGTVVYIGSTSNNVEITGLNDFTIYHLQAWSVTGSGNYSSNVLEVSFHTFGIVPCNSDFSVIGLGEMPFGWTNDGTDIFMQNLPGNIAILQTDSNVSPVTTALTTPCILLAEGKNIISFYYFMDYFFFYSWNPFTSDNWQDGETIQIQLSADDVNYITVFTVNQNNAHDFENPRTHANFVQLMTPAFSNFNGQRVKVRLKLNFYQSLRVTIEDIYIDQIVDEDFYNLAVDQITSESAVLSWEGVFDNYELSYRVVSGEWDYIDVIDSHTYTLENLTRKTNYEVRVRSVSGDDVGSWSGIVSFSTLDIPPCAYPINLDVTEITDISVQLSWEEGNDQNLNWDLRYREALGTSWTNINALEEKTYSLTELNPNTAYLWTVRANCSEDRTSAWATQEEFSTEEGGGISKSEREAIAVFVSGNMLNIINPESKYIEKIQIFDISGKQVGEYIVNTTVNILIPTDLKEDVAIVKIFGKNEVEAYKVFIK
jgi:hypothetical protein